MILNVVLAALVLLKWECGSISDSTLCNVEMLVLAHCVTWKCYCLTVCNVDGLVLVHYVTWKCYELVHCLNAPCRDLL